ncbi:MAG: hypothetical protein OHK0039_28080 [Bacteroidia bacterium]
MNVPGLGEGTTRDLGTIKGDCPAQAQLDFSTCGDEPELPIYVKITWDGGSADAWVTEVPFDLPAPPNTEITVQAWSFSGQVGAQTTVTGPAGVATTLSLDICDGIVLTSTLVTVNGGPFNNLRVTLTPLVIFNVSTATATYSTGDGSTDLFVAPINASGGLTIDNIPGRSTGTFDLAPPGDIAFTFFFYRRIGADSVLISLNEVISGQFNIGTYGAVGGRVTGDFQVVSNGTQFNVLTNEAQNLQNISGSGSFEVLCAPDEQ